MSALPWVIAAAFTGSLFDDQLNFFLGRRKGQAWQDKRPLMQRRSGKVLVLMQTHQTLLILVFRFLYGLRTVTPFFIGMSNIPTRRFMLLNILAALLWALVSGVFGYLFDHAFGLLIGENKRYEVQVFVAISIVGVLIWRSPLACNKVMKPLFGRHGLILAFPSVVYALQGAESQ